jgi:hypothetical protein
MDFAAALDHPSFEGLEFVLLHPKLCVIF